MKKRKQEGMTLIEVVAAMSIFLIVSTALVGTIVTAFNINSRNRAKTNSNANSRTFIEVIKSPSYRPDKYTISTGIAPGNYRFAFKNDTDLEGIIGNLKNYKSVSSDISFDAVKTVASANDKYVMNVKVTWLSTDEIYQLDISSWDLDKGAQSEINRRALLYPK